MLSLELRGEWVSKHMLVYTCYRLGVQTDNVFSPFAQSTAAANKARRLMFMIRRSFQYTSKSTFLPLYVLGYGIPTGLPKLVADINNIGDFKGLLQF